MSYLAFLRERFAECLDGRAYPYERVVCLIAFCIRLCFIVVPVLWYWDGTEWAATYKFIRWIGALVVGWCGAFVWADFGPEERYREIMVGCSVNPNIFPTQTLESYPGWKRGGYIDDDANEALFNAHKFDAFQPWEMSGQPRYDDLPRADWTWAMRFHFRWVRPLLISHDVPGYEWRK
jgi:hypothetical protein